VAAGGGGDSAVLWALQATNVVNARLPNKKGIKDNRNFIVDLGYCAKI
jgi:hypothetical protein